MKTEERKTVALGNAIYSFHEEKTSSEPKDFYERDKGESSERQTQS